MTPKLRVVPPGDGRIVVSEDLRPAPVTLFGITFTHYFIWRHCGQRMLRVKPEFRFFRSKMAVCENCGQERLLQYVSPGGGV